MAHSTRPSPLQPPFASSDSARMAQIRHPSTVAPTAKCLARPEHRCTPPQPQLPPLHAVQRSASVQLPPMQVPPPPPPPGPPSPPRAPTRRSIPVAQLLSSHPPPSPPPCQPANPAQQPIFPPSPLSSASPRDFRPQQPPRFQPARRYRCAQMAVPQPQPHLTYPQEPITSALYPHPHHAHQSPPARATEQSGPQRSSPALSTFSSPTTYTHSEPSPRSSLAPSLRGQAPRAPAAQPPPLNFTLTIRQQPAAARACGFGERDRRVIDPPPILELKITDRIGMPEADSGAMHCLSCELLSPDGKDDETELPPAHPEMPSTRRLMGTLVASPYPAKDENGAAGTFFVFPDLSCRSPGKYRLRFKLLRVDPTHMAPGSRFNGSVASIVTDVFSVYTAKDFPGMRASSALLKSLRRQGLNVGVKKGSEARKGKGKPKKEMESSGASSDDEFGGAGSDSSGSTSPKAASKSRHEGKRRRQGE